MKTYISRSLNRNINKGDIILFYRTAEEGKPAKYSALITTIGIVQEVIDNFTNEIDFIFKAGKRSVFNNEELKKWWNHNPQITPFLINFLCLFFND